MPQIPDAEKFASRQDWIEFEAFSDRIFQSLGFQTFRNYRLKKPRMEVDLVASRNGVTLVVDCKHWKRTVGRRLMSRVAEKQALRARRISNEGMFVKVMPVILTWRDESLFVLQNGVPIIPVHRLADFLLNWEQSAAPLLVFESKTVQKVLLNSG